MVPYFSPASRATLRLSGSVLMTVPYLTSCTAGVEIEQQKGPDCSGPFVWVRCACGLVGAELEVQLGAGHKEVSLVIIVTPGHEHRRASVASGRHRADERA